LLNVVKAIPLLRKVSAQRNQAKTLMVSGL